MTTWSSIECPCN